MDAESAETLSGVIGRLLDGYYQTEPSRQTDQDVEPRPGTACP